MIVNGHPDVKGHPRPVPSDAPLEEVDLVVQAQQVAIPPGTLLCFFTDGLVERPGEVIDEGLDRLCRAMTAEPPEAACAAVMGALVVSEPARDDIALLMIRRHAEKEKDADA